MAGSAARYNPRSPAGRKGTKAPAARRDAKPTVLGRVFARPGVIVAGATFAAVMTGIVANALLFQKGHHPAPLFTPAPVVAPQAAPAAPAPVVTQREIIEAPTPAAAETQPVPSAPVAPPASPASAKAKASHIATKPPGKVAHKPAAHRDLIGDLLNQQGH